MVLRVADGRSQRFNGRGLDARDEQSIRALEQRCRDGDDLLRGLAEPEDHLRHGVAQAAVMVDAREADVLVRQVAELVDGGVYFEAAGRDGIEKGAEALLFDLCCLLWCADP